MSKSHIVFVFMFVWDLYLRKLTARLAASLLSTLLWQVAFLPSSRVCAIHALIVYPYCLLTRYKANVQNVKNKIRYGVFRYLENPNNPSVNFSKTLTMKPFPLAAAAAAAFSSRSSSYGSVARSVKDVARGLDKESLEPSGMGMNSASSSS